MTTETSTIRFVWKLALLSALLILLFVLAIGFFSSTANHNDINKAKLLLERWSPGTDLVHLPFGEISTCEVRTIWLIRNTITIKGTVGEQELIGWLDKNRHFQGADLILATIKNDEFMTRLTKGESSYPLCDKTEPLNHSIFIDLKTHELSLFVLGSIP